MRGSAAATPGATYTTRVHSFFREYFIISAILLRQPALLEQVENN